MVIPDPLFEEIVKLHREELYEDVQIVVSCVFIYPDPVFPNIVQVLR